MTLDTETLKWLADSARQVEEAVKPLLPPDMLDADEEPGYVDNETWAMIDWIAERLEQAYLDELTDSPLEQAVRLAQR